MPCSSIACSCYMVVYDRTAAFSFGMECKLMLAEDANLVRGETDYS